MAKLLRLRRGTTTQHGSFTGAEGEVTVDTDKDTLVVHDNATAGGRPMLREDLNNMPASGVTAGTYGSSSAIPAITVDAKGRVTSATTSAIDSTSISNGTSNVSVAASGDITTTRAGQERILAHGSGVNLTGDVQIEDSSPILTLKDTDSTGNATIHYIRGTNSAGTERWWMGAGSGSNENMWLANTANANLIFKTNNTDRAYFQNDGHFVPNAGATYDLGQIGQQWRNGYFDGTVNTDSLTVDEASTFTGDATFNGGAGAITLGTSCDIRFTTGDWTGETCKIQNHSNTLYIQGASNGIKFRRSNGSDNAEFTSSGHFRPTANNTYDLGEDGFRWRNVYTNDLNLSNEGGTNDVDGTWGSWTIQEGEDDLFLLNRRNGKKYKFNLSEVN